jgi:hypothetical protein
LDRYFSADVRLDPILLCRQMKPRRSVHTISIQQRHRPHFQGEARRYQLFGH